MRKRIVLPLLLALLCGAAPAQAPGYDDERTALLAAKAAADQAEAHAAALNQAAKDASDEASRARAKAEALTEQVKAAQADVAAARARIGLVAALQAEQRRRIGARQAPLMRLMAALQTMARRPPALALAQPGSIDDIVHVRLLLEDTLPVIAQRTAGLRADLARASALRADTERAADAFDQSRALLQHRQQALALLGSTALARSQRLAEEAADEQQRALGLGEESRDLLDRMHGALAADEVRARLEKLPEPTLRPPGPDDSVPVHEGASRYILPVSGSVDTGYREVSNAGVTARGLTLTTAPGATVSAPARGRIVYAQPFLDYGGVVIIDHGGGWTTTITGLASITVKTGETVRQGDILGRANTRQPHIATELRRNGLPVDLLAMAQAG